MIITDPSASINVLDFRASRPQDVAAGALGLHGHRCRRRSHSESQSRRIQQAAPAPAPSYRYTAKSTQHTEIFGTIWESPIGLSPIGNMKAFHPEGERPVPEPPDPETLTANPLDSKPTRQFEDVTETLGRPALVPALHNVTMGVRRTLVERVEAAGCRVIAITIDTQAGSHIETFERSKLQDKRPCVSCHGTTRADFYRRKPMFNGMDHEGLDYHPIQP